MIIYIMRHGTTCWNEIHKVQGWSKNRLSKEGKRLVHETADKNINTHFDIIISSPVMRAMQTANIVKSKNKSKGLKVIKDARIGEIDEGLFVGRIRTELVGEEKKEFDSRSEKYKMEKWGDVYKRTTEFIKEIIKKYRGKSVLIVSHDTPATTIEDYLLDRKVDYENYTYVKNFGNAEMRKYVIKD